MAKIDSKIKIVLLVNQSISAQVISRYLSKNQNDNFEIVGIIRQYFLRKKNIERMNMSFKDKLKELINTKGILGFIWYLGVARWFVSGKSPVRKFLIGLLSAGVIKNLSIDELARKFKIPILVISDINAEECKQFLNKFKPDLGIVCGTGIIKDFIFKIPKFGCINYHNGLLPKYRGCAAVFWQLYCNDNVGYAIHKIDENIDTGNIIVNKKIPYKRANNIWETISLIKKEMSKDCARELLTIISKLKETGRVESYLQNGKNASFFKLPTEEQKKEAEEKFLKGEI